MITIPEDELAPLLGIFTEFVRANPQLSISDPALPRVFRAYAAEVRSEDFDIAYVFDDYHHEGVR